MTTISLTAALSANISPETLILTQLKNGDKNSDVVHGAHLSRLAEIVLNS
jgi:hypothetical protein